MMTYTHIYAHLGLYTTMPLYHKDNDEMYNTVYRMNTRGIMTKVMDCGHEGSEFELQLRYNFNFRTNTIGKCIKLPSYFSSYGLDSIIAVLPQGWHWITFEGWYAVKTKKPNPILFFNIFLLKVYLNEIFLLTQQ